ncbi:hypothetical protein PoB_000869000 [Plakobranchus ocellatus]|uniref:Uncharacterized protein n=1 Tax=Plakobranchus ocellatus TaxID=259542 RepID=A0AAV3YHI1_9GAST|nr:hypothetical protein PoB_000869000 [Plakobranchus ocellatus]
MVDFLDCRRKWCVITVFVLGVLAIAVYNKGSSWTRATEYPVVEAAPIVISVLNAPRPTPVFSSVDVDSLTQLLEQRLALPNPSQRIVYDKPCDPAGKGLTGCTSNCGNALPLDAKPLRDRVAGLVENPRLRLSAQQRGGILSMSAQIPEVDVIIVSASSSNHYSEMQAMFQRLHSVVYPVMAEQKRNFSVVLFDLGLNAEERRMTEQKCRCQVVSFPKHIFPPHVKDNHCYSWKPLIIRSVIERAKKYVVWQDSSIRWTKKFPEIFDNTERYGHQIVRYTNSSRVTANTLKPMFDYMQEDVCPFFPYPEVQASVQLHHRDPLVVSAVLEPWCKCALEKNCICPVDPPTSALPCSSKTLHRCHRYDQSALSIVLAKLYAADMYKVMAPENNFKAPNIVSIERGDNLPKYFSG